MEGVGRGCGWRWVVEHLKSRVGTHLSKHPGQVGFAVKFDNDNVWSKKTTDEAVQRFSLPFKIKPHDCQTDTLNQAQT